MNRDRGGPTRLGMVIFGLLFLLFIGGMVYFITGSSREGRTTEQPETVSVTSLGTSRSVRMTVYGPVVASEDRVSYVITVSPSSRQIQTYRGYDGAAVSDERFAGSSEAYKQFVYALERAGFDKTRTINPPTDDGTGACAAGKRYVFEILDGVRPVTSTWTTTCSKERGTYGGDRRDTSDLFTEQISSFSDIVKPLKLR